MNAEAIKPQCCPLCGQPNACVMAAEGDSSEPCWCVSAQFTPELMQRIPVQAQGKACVCRACVNAASDH